MTYAADHGSAKFTELGYSMNYVGIMLNPSATQWKIWRHTLKSCQGAAWKGRPPVLVRGVMASLVKPSKQAAGAMAQIGLKQAIHTGTC